MKQLCVEAQRMKRAEGIASVTNQLFERRCAALGIGSRNVDSALAELAEHEAYQQAMQSEAA